MLAASLHLPVWAADSNPDRCLASAAVLRATRSALAASDSTWPSPYHILRIECTSTSLLPFQAVSPEAATYSISTLVAWQFSEPLAAELGICYYQCPRGVTAICLKLHLVSPPASTVISLRTLVITFQITSPTSEAHPVFGTAPPHYFMMQRSLGCLWSQCRMIRDSTQTWARCRRGSCSRRASEASHCCDCPAVVGTSCDIWICNFE